MKSKRTFVTSLVVCLFFLAWTPSGFCSPPVIAVSASSEQGAEFGVTNLIDGDLKSRWSSEFADDQWVEIDLNQIEEIDGIVIHWEAAYSKEYQVLVSKGRDSWNAVYSTTNGDGGVDEIVFPKQPARYVRIEATKRATQWGHSILEIVIIQEEESLLAEDTVVERKVLTETILAVDVNQAFYAPGARKTAVVRCNEKLDDGRFSVVNAAGEEVLSGSSEYWGPHWNHHFWVVNFSAIEEEGPYTLKATFGEGRQAEMEVFVSIENIQNAAEKTLSYFYTQRCGVEIPGWHKVCHLDDGVLPDGTHFDATGGWHDCAGFDKEMYTTFLPVYFYTTIAFESDLEWSRRMLEEAKWGADWIMKMTDDSGHTWCHVEPHNLQPDDFIKTWAHGTSTDNIVGTPDDRKITKKAWGPEEGVQAMNMGALAKLGYLIRDEDEAYSERCFAKAKSMMNYLKNQDYYYADEYFLGKGSSHYAIYHSGLLLADMYFYMHEKDEAYLHDARERIDFILDNCRAANGEFLNSSIERVPMSGKSFDSYVNLICFYEFCKLFPDDPHVAKIKASYRKFMEKQVMKRVGLTPYGQAQLLDADLYHYIAVNTLQRNFEKPTGEYCQGKNCYWLSLATICFYANELLGTDEYTDIAIDQIDWVVGKNPFGVSTAAEVGYRFPRMFTMWYWLDNHPAAEGVIPGGLINGIGGDKDDLPYLDMRKTNWLHWETNEYWNPPTAWFAMATWQYYKWARDYQPRAAAAPRKPAQRDAEEERSLLEDWTSFWRSLFE